MKMVALGVMASVLALAASAQAAAPLSNGNFSTPAVSGPTAPSFQNVAKGGSIGAWNVVSGDVDLIGNYWTNPTTPTYPTNSASVDLDGYHPGAISQGITGLKAGQHYDVKFLFSGNPDGGDPAKVLYITIDGVTSKAVFNTAKAHNSDLSMGWISESVGFKANGSDLLTFSSGDTNANSLWGPAIAEVSIAAPEPATWAMMLIGFGGLGAALRMNRRKAAALAV